MSKGQNTETGKTWADRVGAIASSLCAVHCALCAFAPFALGAIGLGVLLSHEAEWALTLFAIAFGVGALVLSWRRYRSKTVATLLTLGIVGLLGARAVEMSSHHDHHDGHHHADAGHAAEEHGHDDAHHEDHAEEDEHEHGDEHHDDHDESEHASTEHGHDGHDDGHESEDDSLHAVGGTLGFAAGLLLFSGHLLNIRTARRRRDECCD